MRLQKLLKDPSLHFLFIGLVIYAASEFISPTVAPDKIHISSSQQEKLEEIWTRQWGRVPTETEMELLIQNHIKERFVKERFVKERFLFVAKNACYSRASLTASMMTRVASARLISWVK